MRSGPIGVKCCDVLAPASECGLDAGLSGRMKHPDAQNVFGPGDTRQTKNRCRLVLDHPNAGDDAPAPRTVSSGRRVHARAFKLFTRP